MQDFTLDSIKHALTDDGLEIYRAEDGVVSVAERVRLHLMDAGVSVHLQPPAVRFTVRVQRSDFPNAAPDELFDKVRQAISGRAQSQGFDECDAATREVTDPMDENKVLDVWHEITFAKPLTHTDSVVQDVRWALGIDKYITR